jgi:nitric oxide reductase subunit B
MDAQNQEIGDDKRSSRHIFLKFGLMEKGSVLGHFAYLSLDFSAAYLHDLGQINTDVSL